MGNSVLCIPQETVLSCARVVGPDAKVRYVEAPVCASHLVLEAPGHVVSRARDLLGTRCVSAMGPAERLVPGEVYLLLREDRVGSRMDCRQMSAVRRAAWRRSRRGPSRMKKGSMMGDANGGAVVKRHEDEVVQRRQPARPYRWKPFLPTILESD